MNVCFLDAVTTSKKPGVGGLSDLTWRLANELTCLGVDVSILGLYEQEVAALYPGINFIKIRPPKFKSKNIFTLLCKRAILALHAKQVMHDRTIFHVSDTISAGMMSLLGLGDRTVWQGNSNVLHNSRYGNPWDFTTYLSLRVFSRLAANSTRYVIALGPSLVDWWLMLGFEPQSIKVIPNGMDPQEQNPQLWNDNAPEKWSAKEYRLLYVGRLARDKGGYIELLNCLQELNLLHFNTALLFVGDGPLRGELENYANRNNNHESVNFLGNQPKSVVRSVYAKADLLVLPSINEMLPRVMLEAWAHGIAFMGTNVGAVGDYLVDGYNGFLLTSLDQDYFVNRVKSALVHHKLRKVIVENGRSEVKKFCWSIIGKKYLDLYETVSTQIL